MNHKRAALIFDRIFVPAGDFPYLETPQALTFGDGFEGDHPDWELWLQHGLNVYSKTNNGMLGFDRYVADTYAESGYTVIPGYSDNSSFSARGGGGDSVEIYGIALANLPVVSDEVKWDQILEFREDKGSLQKIRRFRLWLSQAQGLPPEAAEDAINVMLDDYNAAINKHGLKTVTGGLTWLSAALVTGYTTSSAGLLGMFASGLALAAGTVAWLVTTKASLDEIERGKDSGVAVIYEARKRFGNDKGTS